MSELKENFAKSSKELMNLVMLKNIRKKKSRNPFHSAEPFYLFVQKLAAKEQEQLEQEDS